MQIVAAMEAGDIICQIGDAFEGETDRSLVPIAL